MSHFVRRDCPQCLSESSSKERIAGSPEAWPLKKCRWCGFIYLERAPTYEGLRFDYAWEKTSEQETARRRQVQPLVSRFSDTLNEFRRTVLKRDKLPRLVADHLGGRGILVDVGCAEGGVLSRLPDTYAKIGIEISTRLAAQAAELLPQATIIHADAVSGLWRLEGRGCAGIILSAFLEHEIEPRMLLFHAFHALRPGGIVIVKVPNYASLNRIVRGSNWCGFRFPDHVNYFTPHSLRRMAGSVGFEIARCRMQDRLPTSDNLWAVLIRPNETPDIARLRIRVRPCSRPEPGLIAASL